MRIAFDGTTLYSPQTGIGYYTEHLLHHLALEAPDHEWTVISNRRVSTSLPLASGIEIFRGFRFPVRNVWMQMLAPLVLKRLGSELAHFTNFVAPVLKQAPTVLSIHDMSLQLFPSLHPPNRIATRPIRRWAAQRADAIITMSESARRDIVNLAGVSAERIHVIPEAPASVFQPARDQAVLDSVRRRYGLAQRVILFVGTIEPRKNLSRLIQAYARLRRSGSLPHQLVCVGHRGWGERQVRSLIDSLNLEEAVLLTGYVPFHDLPALYGLSEFFVFPSIHEGFGLPVLEAMACGTPVITSATSSLGEVAGNAAELVDPEETESILEALRRLASDAGRRRELSRLGLSRARQFSWQQSARETLAVYRKVVSGATS